jgi:hypothetical protein
MWTMLNATTTASAAAIGGQTGEAARWTAERKLRGPSHATP